MIFQREPHVDLRELFGNTNPVEIEIGSGKGAFLLAHAESHPHVNFLGIENQAAYARLVRERITKRALANARILHADASLVFSRFLRDATVRAVHVYFPDPWWKRRHHKRRLLTRELGGEILRTLEPGGTLWLATDVGHRFEEMLSELASLPFERALGEIAPGRALTNFERKYRAEGRTLFYAALRKPPSPP